MITNLLLAIMCFIFAIAFLFSAVASTPGTRHGVDPKLKAVNIISMMGFVIFVILFIGNIIKFLSGLF